MQWGSIESNGILAKFLYLSSEKRFIQRSHPLNTIPRSKIWLFIGIQALGVACTVAISQTIAAIGFPVLITALIPLRTFLMPRWFTEHELSVLDHLTADNPAVLVSFGGTPAKMKKHDGKDLAQEGVDDLGGYETDGEGHEESAERQHIVSLTR
jgi:hypothetical protein